MAKSVLWCDSCLTLQITARGDGLEVSIIEDDTFSLTVELNRADASDLAREINSLLAGTQPTASDPTGLKTRRARLGLTSRDVAAELGISNTYISQLENGKKAGKAVLNRLDAYYASLEGGV